MKKIKEIDYLYASGRIRVMEGFLLNKERANRMMDTRSMEEAFRQLADCGYEVPASYSAEALEQLLSAEHGRIFDTVSAMIPEPRLVDIFRVRYDVHNIKVALKASFMNKFMNSSTKLPFQAFGRIPTDQLLFMMSETNLRAMPKTLAAAIEEAKECLGRTGDPQWMDIRLDQYCLKEMLELALALPSPFLVGYIRLLIDATNLKILVRLKKMNNSSVSLSQVLIPNGNVTLEHLMADHSEHRLAHGLEYDLEDLFAASPLHLAASAGVTSLRNGTASTEVDRLCDNCLMAYLQPARTLAFGHQLIVAYLIAKENEITALRSILSGKLAGESPESIRERIRDHYV